jgi:hypothetical protein
VGAVLQIFLAMLLGSGVVFGADYRDVQKVSLKKDLQKKILVKYAQYERLFKFRWTLYINGGLVVFHSYDKRVAQNILRLNHTNQSFRVALKPRGLDHYNVPYLLVTFKKFDYEKNEALFELYLWGEKMQIQLQNIK